MYEREQQRQRQRDRVYKKEIGLKSQKKEERDLLKIVGQVVLMWGWRLKYT